MLLPLARRQMFLVLCTGAARGSDAGWVDERAADARGIEAQAPFTDLRFLVSRGRPRHDGHQTDSGLGACGRSQREENLKTRQIVLVRA